MTTKAITVVLADDHPVVRSGIRHELQRDSDILVVGEAADGHETLRVCEELVPDVLLLDLSMPGPGPLELVASLQERCPETKILILSAYDDDVWVHNLIEAGVAAYLLKDEALGVVTGTIRAVVTGGTGFSRSILEKLGQGRGGTAELAALTNRERQLLEAMVRGWDFTRIAAEFGVKRQTVRNYASRLYEKVGVHSCNEAITWARARGIGNTSGSSAHGAGEPPNFLFRAMR